MPFDYDRVHHSRNFYRLRLQATEAAALARIWGITVHATRGGAGNIGRPDREFSASERWLTQWSYKGADGKTYRNPSSTALLGHAEMIELVPDQHGPWTNGTGSAANGANVRRLSVEVVQATIDTPYTDYQYERFAEWAADRSQRYDFPIRKITGDAGAGINGHEDFKRAKSDPGPAWDWDRALALARSYVRAGGTTPAPAPPADDHDHAGILLAIEGLDGWAHEADAAFQAHLEAHRRSMAAYTT